MRDLYRDVGDYCEALSRRPSGKHHQRLMRKLSQAARTLLKTGGYCYTGCAASVVPAKGGDSPTMTLEPEDPFDDVESMISFFRKHSTCSEQTFMLVNPPPEVTPRGGAGDGVGGSSGDEDDQYDDDSDGSNGSQKHETDSSQPASKRQKTGTQTGRAAPGAQVYLAGIKSTLMDVQNDITGLCEILEPEKDGHEVRANWNQASFTRLVESVKQAVRELQTFVRFGSDTLVTATDPSAPATGAPAPAWGPSGAQQPPPQHAMELVSGGLGNMRGQTKPAVLDPQRFVRSGSDTPVAAADPSAPATGAPAPSPRSAMELVSRGRSNVRGQTNRLNNDGIDLLMEVTRRKSGAKKILVQRATNFFNTLAHNDVKQLRRSLGWPRAEHDAPLERIKEKYNRAIFVVHLTSPEHWVALHLTTKRLIIYDSLNNSPRGEPVRLEEYAGMSAARDFDPVPENYCWFVDTFLENLHKFPELGLQLCQRRSLRILRVHCERLNQDVGGAPVSCGWNAVWNAWALAELPDDYRHDDKNVFVPPPYPRYMQTCSRNEPLLRLTMYNMLNECLGGKLDRHPLDLVSNTSSPLPQAVVDFVGDVDSSDSDSDVVSSATQLFEPRATASSNALADVGRASASAPAPAIVHDMATGVKPTACRTASDGQPECERSPTKSHKGRAVFSDRRATGKVRKFGKADVRNSPRFVPHFRKPATCLVADSIVTLADGMTTKEVGQLQPGDTLIRVNANWPQPIVDCILEKENDGKAMKIYQVVFSRRI